MRHWASAHFTPITGLLCSCAMFLAACSGGGSGGGNSGTPSPTATSTPEPPALAILETSDQANRFLSRTSFGPSQTEISTLTGADTSSWFRNQVSAPVTRSLPFILDILNNSNYQSNGSLSYLGRLSPRYIFFINAIEADDQLRQRVAFALSEILVVSNEANSKIRSHPEALGYYMDILATNAFGNYRDLLDEVTYSPAMSYMLTYNRNRPANMSKGRVPDENYAREIMQLFTIGLVNLNMDGSDQTDSNGDAIETYTNDDITGLAKVFTGLALESEQFWGDSTTDLPDRYYKPLKVFEDYHSIDEKSFLGTTIPSDTGGEESIRIALDTIFEHPNVAPFVSHKLIQRLVTSNPSAAYIERVANAFESGRFELPDGSSTGTGERGDLSATIAAILFDEDAMSDSSLNRNSFGKVREPLLRFTHWARAFDAAPVDPETSQLLRQPHRSSRFSQGPYSAPSVFNFFRPGYIAPGTASGAAGLTAPELQLFNTGNLPGYVNTMTKFILNTSSVKDTFIPDYSDEIALADDPDALVDHLNNLLTYGNMSDETRSLIIEMLNNITVTDDTDPAENGLLDRVELAVLAVFTSPDYLVQR